MVNSVQEKNIYLPFFYSEKVKRVGENYTSRVILWDDLPLLLFAFSWQANHSLLHGLGIFFLLVSFWCVYELGYYENDYVAEKYEEQPKLSKTYYTHNQMMQTGYPWLWSLVFGFCGVALIEKAQSVDPTSVLSLVYITSSRLSLPLLSWIGFLISLRLCFWVYNYLNKHTRTWLYIVLQSFRYYGFVVVTSTNLIGTSLLSSNILARTILYVVYRYSGGNVDNWPKQVPEKLLRWLIFVLILSAIAIGTQSFALWQSWQTWTIIAWCLVQGKGQFIRLLAQVKPIFADGSNLINRVN